LAWVATLALAGCGGGGADGASSPATDTATVSTATVSARLLAGNRVELSITGVSAASRVCLRQGSAPPLASDSCFSDPDSLLRQVQKALPGSATQQEVFSAWLLTGASVSLHGRLSLPGKTCSEAAYTAASSSALPTVCVITDFGDSVLALEPAKAPVTVGNFLRYVNQGFYDQTVFHRFGKSALSFAQGGGFSFNNGDYRDKPATQSVIPLESTLASKLSNTAGTIAMARANDPDTAAAGFFINTGDNLDFDSSTARNGYAVFGRVIFGASTWTDLVASVGAVPGETFVTFPRPPIALQWAYQIQPSRMRP
jgi:cyclophilin family peptidyl-prolyl cis-trans isomerase